MLKPVINELGLDETVAELAGQLTVTNPISTAFVNISAVDGDPKQAADIANAVAESLQDVIQNDLYSTSGQVAGEDIHRVEGPDADLEEFAENRAVSCSRCGFGHYRGCIRRTDQGFAEHQGRGCLRRAWRGWFVRIGLRAAG